MPEIKIRDNPNLRSFLRNIAEMSFTSIIWALWIYLLLPVVNLVLWWFGIRNFQIEVIEKVGYLDLFNLIRNMGWIVLTAFLIMRLWGYYNYVRFGRRERRRNRPHMPEEQIAGHFGLPVDDIRALQFRKEIEWPLDNGRQRDAND